MGSLPSPKQTTLKMWTWLSAAVGLVILWSTDVLSTLPSLHSIVDVAAVADYFIPTFISYNDFIQASSSQLFNQQPVNQPLTQVCGIEPLFSDSVDGIITNVSLIIALVGVVMLMCDIHFSRPVCAVVSLGFWLAVLWIGVMLSPTVGVGLGLVASWMRKSWVLFPEKAGSGESPFDRAG